MKKVVMLFLLLFAIPAFAVSVPEYNIEKECKNIAEMSGGSSQVELFCRQEEQTAKEHIGKMHVSARAMRFCREVAEFSGNGNYLLLKECLKEEMAAEKELGR